MKRFEEILFFKSIFYTNPHLTNVFIIHILGILVCFMKIKQCKYMFDCIVPLCNNLITFCYVPICFSCVLVQYVFVQVIYINICSGDGIVVVLKYLTLLQASSSTYFKQIPPPNTLHIFLSFIFHYDFAWQYTLIILKTTMIVASVHYVTNLNYL